MTKYQQLLEMIWAIGLMEITVCIWDVLANPNIGPNLLQTTCSSETLATNNKKSK
jgi:hypothetical protein